MSKSTETSTARIAILHTDMKKIFEGLGTEISKLRKDENETIAKIQKEADERCKQIQINCLNKIALKDKELEHTSKSHAKLFDKYEWCKGQKDALELENRKLRRNLEKLQNDLKESIDQTMSKLAGSKQMLQSTDVALLENSETESDSESDTETDTKSDTKSEGEMLTIPQIFGRKSGRPLTTSQILLVRETNSIRRKQITQQGPRKVAQRKAKFGQESTKKTTKKRSTCKVATCMLKHN